MPQTFLSPQNSTTATPAAAGTVTPDVSLYGAYSITMPAGNITIANPTGSPQQGNTLLLVFTQDATGARTITWGSKFKTAWNPAAAASAISSIAFWYDGTNWQMWAPSAFDDSGNAYLSGNKIFNTQFVNAGPFAAAAAVTNTLWVSDGAYQVTGVNAVWSTASASGLLTITLDTATGAPGSGTAQLTGTIDTSTTANTVAAGVVAATAIAAGNRLAMKWSGTLTGLVGLVITITLKKL